MQQVWGAQVESADHLMWECPANDQIKSKHIYLSNELKGLAARGHESKPILWLRGLAPADWWSDLVGKELPEWRTWAAGLLANNAKVIFHEPHEAATDG